MVHRRLLFNLIFVFGFVITKKFNCFVFTARSSYFGRKQLLLDGRPYFRSVSCCSTALHSDKFNREIDELSRQRAASEAKGSVAAGAVLGGLVCGPFGALFGAAVGGNIGAKNAFDRARKEEMKKKGITQDMLDAAEEIGYALEQSMIGMESTKESLTSQQSLARQIEKDVNDHYEKARVAMIDGQEEDARSFLLRRNADQERLKVVLKQCADEMKRIDAMKRNVSTLQKRAIDVEAMLQRAIGAKARQGSHNLVARQSRTSDPDFSLSEEDPLLKKFRDLGID